jgi:hypothetical protein
MQFNFLPKPAYICGVRALVLLVLSVIASMHSTASAQSAGYEDCALDKTLQVQAMLDSMAAANFKANRIQGFRILLYSGNNRDEAGKAKETVYRLFPKSDVYTAYSAPTFKVRTGDFYTRIDAWQHLIKLKAAFPGAVITNEIVIVKP